MEALVASHALFWSCRQPCCESDRNGYNQSKIPSKKFDRGHEFQVIDDDLSDEFSAPRMPGFQTFSTTNNQPLRGVPVRDGELYHLTDQGQAQLVYFSLYINGFTFTAVEEGSVEETVCLTPFSMVRTCQFRSGALSDMKVFKVSHFSTRSCNYFGLQGDEDFAELERARWIADISHAMSLVTQSLFPNFQLSCDSIPGVPCTESRLLAGYLVHLDDENSVSMLYSELHAHRDGSARLTLYEHEKCENPLTDVHIHEGSRWWGIGGKNCSCFGVDEHSFASRTVSEQKLWLRAISNLKVKLHHLAPDPDPEQISYFRDAIKEQIDQLGDSLQVQVTGDSLLQRCPRKTFRSVGCGDMDPLPFPSSDDDSSEDENGTFSSSMLTTPGRSLLGGEKAAGLGGPSTTPVLTPPADDWMPSM